MPTEDMFTNNNLTLDALLAMTPDVQGIDIVQMAARHMLLSHVKSQSCVREVFFPKHKEDAGNASRVDPAWFPFPRFACLYVCQAICRLRDQFELHTLLLEEKVDIKLAETYKSPQWKKLGKP